MLHLHKVNVMSLHMLESRIRTELEYLDFPPRAWVRPQEGPGAVFDVVIVGGGQSGLAAAFGLLREKVTRAEWVRLWLVSLGLLLITPSFELSNLGTEGLLWGLLSGASFGVLAVLNRRYLTEVNAFAVAGLQNAVVFLVMSPWVLGSLGQISLTNWLWVAALGVLCTGLAHLLFVSSLRHLPARTAGLVVALEPIYAIAFAWWFFSQEPLPRTLLGAAVIILTILSASLALQKAR